MLFCALAPAVALAQFKDESPTKGTQLGASSGAHRIRVGVQIKATGGSLLRVVATAPVPAEWPEQQVSIVKEDISPAIKSVTYRTISSGGSLKQMVVEIPQLSAGQEAHALVTFEVARRAVQGPKDTATLVTPKKADRAMAINLGAGPYIESRHPKIASAAKEAVTDKETDWQKAEAIYDWVRDHVKYTHGEMKGAARTLAEKEGDLDDLTSLFVAMCRSQKIPARTVFVRDGCYAEFYLTDEEGTGYWFPCQPAGERSFGSISDPFPILQKGDNYKNPENPKERLRYMKEYFTAAGRGKQPNVEFISEMVAE